MAERLIDIFQGDIKTLGESFSVPANTEKESSLPRLLQVREIWNSYQTDPSLKPSWVPEQALRFLMISAAIGTLDKLDQFDPRTAEVLIRYFMTKDTLQQMESVAEVSSPAAVFHVIRKAVDRLWDEMPEQGQRLAIFEHTPFPLDKRAIFPRERLHRNRLEHMREIAKTQWEISPEARRERRLAIRRGKERAREKADDSQLRRRQREKLEAENSTDSH